MKAGLITPETYDKLLDTLSVIIYSVEVDENALLQSVSGKIASQEFPLQTAHISHSSVSFLDFIHPDFRAEYSLKRLQLKQEPNQEPLIYKMKGNDGEWVWVKDVFLKRNARHINEACIQLEKPGRQEGGTLKSQSLLEESGFSRELINSLDFILGVIDFNGVLLEVNTAWEQFAQIPDFNSISKKTKGANYFELLRQAPLLDPKRADEVIQGIKQVIENPDHIFSVEINYGNYWFNLKVNKFIHSDLLVLSHYNITRMKEVKQKLAFSETRLRTILDTEPECVKILDHDGCLIEMNKAGLTMVDAENLEDLMGQKVVDLVIPEYKQAFEKSVEDALNGKSTSFEFVISSLKGRLKVMESQVVPFNHDPDNPQVLSITRDITEKKMSEAMARRVDERFKHLIENINDSFMLDDLDGNITFANKQFQKTFGFDPEKERKTFRDLVAPEHLSMVQFRHDNRIHNREQVESTFEFLAINASGERVWMEANVTLLKDEGVITGTQSILRNIHQRKNFEIELEKMNQQLRERNHELDRFVYSISHDLRSPIISLMSVLDVVEEEFSPQASEAFKDYLMQMRLCTNRTDQIIRNILYYSKNKNLNVSKEEINLAHEINQIAEAQRLLAGVDELQFVNQVDKNKVFETDAMRLRIILENILSNAIRYQKSDSRHIARIVVCLKQIPGYSLIISIKDNGEGIQPDVLPNIFKMFYRGTYKSTGSGLGLYLAQEAVKRMKGTIQVNTVPDEGSEFLICFPENTHDKV